MDCSNTKSDPSEENDACEGGFMYFAYHHYIKHPAYLESEYPYKGVEGSCKEKKVETKSPIKNIKGWHYLADDIDGT